jgi:hypothetical protein
VTLELVYGLMQQTATDLWKEGRAAGLDEGALKVHEPKQKMIEPLKAIIRGRRRSLHDSIPSPPHSYHENHKTKNNPTQTQTRILAAVQLYRGLVSAPTFPRFITTYLYEQALFQQLVRRAPVS